jgi:hypothetical protein
MAGFDIGQMFTPPKSKTPWTAMTEGSTDKDFKGAEQWGPMIEAISKFIPYVGPFLAVGEGEMGMGGRNTGFQGTDYGWGNVGPMVSGATGSMGGGGYGNLLSGLTKGLGSYWDKSGNSPIGGYNLTYDRSQDPNGSNLDFSQLLSSFGQGIGNYYGGGMGSTLGSTLGNQIGSQVSNQVAQPNNQANGITNFQNLSQYLGPTTTGTQDVPLYNMNYYNNQAIPTSMYQNYNPYINFGNYMQTPSMGMF